MRIPYTIPHEGELRSRRRWVWFLDLAPCDSNGVHEREIRFLEFAWVLERYVERYHESGVWIPSRWLSEQEIAALEGKQLHGPAVLRPDWSMTARLCRECGTVLHPVALWEGDGWVLVYDCCDACGDDRDMMTEVEWPFVENWATRQDFERVGFRVE